MLHANYNIFPVIFKFSTAGPKPPKRPHASYSKSTVICQENSKIPIKKCKPFYFESDSMIGLMPSFAYLRLVRSIKSHWPLFFGRPATSSQFCLISLLTFGHHFWTWLCKRKWISSTHFILKGTISDSCRSFYSQRLINMSITSENV